MADFTLEQLKAERARRQQAAAAPAQAAPAAGGGFTLEQLQAEKARRAGGGENSGMGQMLGDIGRSFSTGVRSGLESLAGIPGDVGQLQGNLLSKGAEFLGASPESIETVKKYGGGLPGLFAPTGQDVHEATVPVVGESYQPKTTAGEYARTVGEFAPGVVGPGGPAQWLGRAATDVVLPAIMSETAGQMTEGTSLEPWARMAGGLVSGGTAQMFKQGERTRAAQEMLDEGIPLSAGQQTNSRALKYAESEIGGTPYANLLDRQQAAFTGRAMEAIGAPPGTMATQENMAREYGRIGQQFDDLIFNAGAVPVDVPTQQAIMGAVDDYRQLVAQGNQAPVVEGTMQGVRDLFTANGNTPMITGEQYQAFRRQLGENIRSTDPETSQALRRIQDALDDAVEASFAGSNPDMVGQWGETRRQYRNYLDLEKAITGGDKANLSEGVITPARLATGVSSVEGQRALAQGRGDLAELAAHGSAAMKAMPESGTAMRAGVRMAASAPAIAAGVGGPAAALPAAAAVALPSLAGRALMSGPVQNALVGVPDRARQALAAALAAQQARGGGGGGGY